MPLTRPDLQMVQAYADYTQTTDGKLALQDKQFYIEDTIDSVDKTQVINIEFDAKQGVLNIFLIDNSVLKVEGLPTEDAIPIGDKGPKGYAGIDGIDGVDGADGRPGEPGCQGVIGPQGQTGSKGPQGEEGSKGMDGDKGDRGSDGAKGESGDRGDVGPQGPPGDDGKNGSLGYVDIIVSDVDPSTLNKTKEGTIWVSPNAPVTELIAPLSTVCVTPSPQIYSDPWYPDCQAKFAKSIDGQFYRAYGVSKYNGSTWQSLDWLYYLREQFIASTNNENITTDTISFVADLYQKRIPDGGLGRLPDYEGLKFHVNLLHTEDSGLTRDNIEQKIKEEPEYISSSALGVDFLTLQEPVDCFDSADTSETTTTTTTTTTTSTPTSTGTIDNPEPIRDTPISTKCGVSFSGSQIFEGTNATTVIRTVTLNDTSSTKRVVIRFNNAVNGAASKVWIYANNSARTLLASTNDEFRDPVSGYSYSYLSFLFDPIAYGPTYDIAVQNSSASATRTYVSFLCEEVVTVLDCETNSRTLYFYGNPGSSVVKSVVVGSTLRSVILTYDFTKSNADLRVLGGTSNTTLLSTGANSDKKSKTVVYDPSAHGQNMKLDVLFYGNDCSEAKCTISCPNSVVCGDSWKSSTVYAASGEKSSVVVTVQGSSPVILAIRVSTQYYPVKFNAYALNDSRTHLAGNESDFLTITSSSFDHYYYMVEVNPSIHSNNVEIEIEGGYSPTGTTVNTTTYVHTRCEAPPSVYTQQTSCKTSSYEDVYSQNNQTREIEYTMPSNSAMAGHIKLAVKNPVQWQFSLLNGSTVLAQSTSPVNTDTYFSYVYNPTADGAGNLTIRLTPTGTIGSGIGVAYYCQLQLSCYQAYDCSESSSRALYVKDSNIPFYLTLRMSTGAGTRTVTWDVTNIATGSTFNLRVLALTSTRQVLYSVSNVSTTSTTMSFTYSPASHGEYLAVEATRTAGTDSSIYIKARC